MKTKLALLLAFTALTVSAQTNSVHNWTLKSGAVFPGDYFTSGTQMVVIKSHGTNCLLKISELSTNDWLYFQECKAAERQAEHQKYIASLTNRVIQVVAVIDNLGQCQTSVGRVYLTGLPASVSEYANRYNALKSDVENLKVRVDKLHRGTIAPGNEAEGWYDGVAQDWELARDDLEKIAPSFKVMETGLKKNTSVVAYPTGTIYGPAWLPLWQCVGVEP